MPQFSDSSTAKLATCDPRLITLFEKVIQTWDCQIICGHRGKADQDAAFLAGKSKRRWPNGEHNTLPSRAVDVVPYPLDWEDIRRFYFFAGYVKRVAEDLGIGVRWGGDWDGDLQVKDQNFHDLPHWELT
jgi:peptidoglycan L-alanyl-D-glutamate endopeptidase CwlK